MDEHTGWWEVLKAPLAFMSAPFLLKALEYWNGRNDRRETKQSHGVDRREVVLLADRELLNQAQRELDRRGEVERAYVTQEAERLRTERRVLERDRDRGWNLARFYFRLANEMEHSMNDARQIVDLANLNLPLQQKVMIWPKFAVPRDLEAPFPPTDGEP